ncbi:hypothetical protein LZ30DRAFT_182306 [Colletotrichum cereale]|nr:hypothetical protein LZ30DRAFT_182306 [Colletotrichum cereale]
MRRYRVCLSDVHLSAAHHQTTRAAATDRWGDSGQEAMDTVSASTQVVGLTILWRNDSRLFLCLDCARPRFASIVVGYHLTRWASTSATSLRNAEHPTLSNGWVAAALSHERSPRLLNTTLKDALRRVPFFFFFFSFSLSLFPPSTLSSRVDSQQTCHRYIHPGNNVLRATYQLLREESDTMKCP